MEMDPIDETKRLLNSESPGLNGSSRIVNGERRYKDSHYGSTEIDGAANGDIGRNRDGNDSSDADFVSYAASNASKGSQNPSKTGSNTSKTPYELYLDHENEHELREQMMRRLSSTTEDAPMIAWIINLSLGVNILLFVLKIGAFSISGSLSIAASVVDSFLDLLVQLIIYVTNEGQRSTDDKAEFPAGKGRFEPVGIILCASLMMLAALELIVKSFGALYDGIYKGYIDGVTIDLISLSIVAIVIVIKAVLWLYCRVRSDLSDTVATLSFDHRNDVLSNLVALAAIALVKVSSSLWWTDSVGCIIISAYIAHNWFEMGVQKVYELVGRSAKQSFIDEIEQFVNSYHPGVLKLDCVRAYHFGSKYLVEIEAILPSDMSVREAHHISLALQQAIERMEDVERAFVHVDYKSRKIDEHDVVAVSQRRLDKIRKTKHLMTKTVQSNTDSFGKGPTLL